MSEFKDNIFNQENPILSSKELLSQLPARDRKNVMRIVDESKETIPFQDFVRSGQEIKNLQEKEGFLTKLVKKYGSKIAGTMAVGMLFAGFIWQGEQRVKNAEKTTEIHNQQNPVKSSEDYFGDVVTPEEQAENASEEAAWDKARADYEKKEEQRIKEYERQMNEAAQHPEDLTNIH